MTNRLNGLTILRGFAAIWVMLLHTNNRVPLFRGNWVAQVIDNGTHAMSFFFILSGAVLSYNYAKLKIEPTDLVRFYRARFARIYPAYIAASLLAVLWFGLSPAADWMKWLYVNILVLLGLQAWMIHSIAFGINGGTWSVSAEFFFYAVFPFILIPLRWLKPSSLSRLCFYLCCLSGFFGLSDRAFVQQNTFIYYVTPLLRLPEFIVGVALGLMLLRPAPTNIDYRGRCLIAFAVTLAASSLHSEGAAFRLQFLTVPCFAWLIYTVARLEQSTTPPWHARPVRFFLYLGEASYCLFLFHLIPMVFISSPFGTTWSQSFIDRYSGWLFWGMTIAVSFFGAILMHELIEKPARRWLLRSHSNPLKPVSSELREVTQQS